MEFYKEAKSILIPAGTTLDMGGATFNHKALVVSSSTDISNIIFKVYFYDKGTIGNSTQNFISMTAQSTASIMSFTDAIIPCRVAKIQNTNITHALQCLLLN